MRLFAEKRDFSNKKRPKRDPKSGLGLLRDLGLPKRDPVGSSVDTSQQYLESGLYIKKTHSNFHGCTLRISLSTFVNFTIFALF